MRGRKRTPSNIIALRGGVKHTHRPPRTNEPKPPVRLPPCPGHLDKVARKEWRRVGKMLLAVRVITDLDRAVLSVYCQAWSEYVQACEEIPKKQPVWIARDGYPKLNPWLRVEREACERMMKAMSELGLSPSSRARLNVENAPEKSAEDEFLEGARG